MARGARDNRRLGLLLTAALGCVSGCKRAPARAVPVDAGAVLEWTEPAPARTDAGSQEPPPLDVVALAREKTYTSLKDARAHRESVVKLALEGQGLTAVPGLSQLKRLQRLDLARNRLSDVPGLAALTRLESLDLSDNPLKRPPEVGTLHDLQELDLSRTQVATLPFDLGRLQALRTLRVGSERLHRLPEELTDAASLTTLSLHGCSQLESLPMAMGKLRQLTLLDLVGTRVPKAEVDRVQALLPQLHVLRDEAPEDSAQLDGGDAASVPAEPAQDTGCAQLLQRGWQQPAQGDEEPAALQEQAERFAQCAQAAAAPEREALAPRTRAALDTVERGLKSFEDALFDLASVPAAADTDRVDRSRLSSPGARAAVDLQLVHRLAGGAGAGGAEVPAALEGQVHAGLQRLVDGTPSDTDEDYQRALGVLQDRTEGLLQALKALPAGARAPVLQRMVTLLAS